MPLYIQCLFFMDAYYASFTSSLIFPSSPSISLFKVSLHLRLYAERTIVTPITAQKIWEENIIKGIGHLVMDLERVKEVKKGLEFGQQVRLSHKLTFSGSPLLLAKLFASEGRMRPFQHLRYREYAAVSFYKYVKNMGRYSGS